METKMLSAGRGGGGRPAAAAQCRASESALSRTDRYSFLYGRMARGMFAAMAAYSGASAKGTARSLPGQDGGTTEDGGWDLRRAPLTWTDSNGDRGEWPLRALPPHRLLLSASPRAARRRHRRRPRHTAEPEDSGSDSEPGPADSLKASRLGRPAQAHGCQSGSAGCSRPLTTTPRLGPGPGADAGHLV
jgi:hypothetical protein